MKPLVDRRRRSARERFQNCQFAYHAEYIDGVSVDSDESRRGSAFHRARELYIRSLWTAKTPHDEDLARQAFSQAMIELPLPQEARDRCAELWARWVERFELPVSQFYSVEGALPGAFDTLLRYDLVLVPQADTLEIIDAKSHWRMPSMDRLRASYQPKFYLAAARRLFPGFLHYRLRFEFVSLGELTEPIEYSAAELDAIDRQIAEQDAAMTIAEDTDGYVWPATGGTHCAYCPVSAQCPLNATAAGMAVGPLRTAQEAREAISTLSAMSARAAFLREQLAAFCETVAGGSISAGGMEWAHRQKADTTYPARGVLAVLDAVKADYTLKVGYTAVKPLLTSKRKWVHVADQIAALGTTKVSTEFSGKPLEPDSQAQEPTP